jgi:Na+/H+ antiporter NhaA
MGCDPPPIPRAVRGTFEWFVHSEVAGSLLLLATTAVALVLANSPLAGAYDHILQTKVGILAASLLSGIIGSTVLGPTLPRKERTR